MRNTALYTTVDNLDELGAMTKCGTFMAEVLHIGYPDVFMSSSQSKELVRGPPELVHHFRL
jgi:hypothetical protein